VRSPQDDSPTLEAFGWNETIAERFAIHADEGLVPARVGAEHRGAYVLFTQTGEVTATIPGRARHDSERGDLPAVGDWVAAEMLPGEDRAMIRHILPRTSKFSRKVAGKDTEEQVLVANVDYLFIASALDQDFNLRRAERYLTLAWESGATPVVVLTKSDLCKDIPKAMRDFEAVAPGVEVHAVSAVTDEGFEGLARYLTGGATVGLLGSSGVGKSTIVNRLAGSSQKVQAIREDGKGRHTTTHRQLIVVGSGGVLVDTPGMRELQLWESEGGLEQAFDDIASLAAGCRFTDCAHEQEPGCAVIEARRSGTLTEERLDSYRKLQKELAHLEIKKDARARKVRGRNMHAANAEARRRARLRY
jgi:ribosome biogenesis GTPase